MKVLALVMALLISLGYLKNIKVVLKSPRRMEEEFKANLQVQQEKNGKEAFNLSMIIGLILTVAFMIVYFTITASVTGSMFMVIIASIFIVYDLGVAYRLIMYLTDQGDYRLGVVDKLFTLSQIAYLIAFFILIL